VYPGFTFVSTYINIAIMVAEMMEAYIAGKRVEGQ
jgi:hypothetical protein